MSIWDKALLGLGGIAVAILIFGGAYLFGRWLASPTRHALGDCRHAIRQQLLTPSTAHFHDGYVNGKYAYWTVDAENAFGARLTHKFECAPGRFGQLAVRDLQQ